MSYLSKRENNTYSIIVNGCSICPFMEKKVVLKIAENMKIKLSERVWSGEKGDWIIEK